MTALRYEHFSRPSAIPFETLNPDPAEASKAPMRAPPPQSLQDVRQAAACSQASGKPGAWPGPRRSRRGWRGWALQRDRDNGLRPGRMGCAYEQLRRTRLTSQEVLDNLLEALDRALADHAPRRARDGSWRKQRGKQRGKQSSTGAARVTGQSRLLTALSSMVIRASTYPWALTGMRTTSRGRQRRSP